MCMIVCHTSPLKFSKEAPTLLWEKKRIWNTYSNITFAEFLQVLWAKVIQDPLHFWQILATQDSFFEIQNV